jgi:DNA-binding transcriptional ArsR family regulator
MAQAKKLAKVFAALSVDTRVKIVQLLKEDCLCVNALAARLSVTAPAVSQHLRVLRDADLVIAEKRGYFVHYRINRRTLTSWKGLADGLLAAGAESRARKP